MPEVNVATDPMLVYGLVALFVGAVVLALLFVRPRRGLGAIKPSDVPNSSPSGELWMPGGDVFGREPQATPEPQPVAAEAWPPQDPWPASDPWQSAVRPAQAPAPPQAGAQAPVHDPWSTGATGQPGQEPRWDKR
ncbi:MAG: hypothetical protein QOJ81_71 [Chloroflexota bacterium]|jgi:hypothetical protein|nr:hypothetical protein [Chloroflexota bacterium]